MRKEEILKEYFSDTTGFSIDEIGQGAINETFLVVKEEEKYILQKMGNIFTPLLSQDIEFITAHLGSRGTLTPTIKRTLSNNLFVPVQDSWWRMLAYIEGETYEYITNEKWARSAGRYLGAFHLALLDCEYDFKFSIPHFHDIPYTMQKLRDVLSENQGTAKYAEISSTASKILAEYDKIKFPTSLPKRIIHGDLKISNIRFRENGEVVALIDLDTFMHASIAIELGDALRSWCMPGGEDAEDVRFDRKIYDSALEGYLSSASFLTDEERISIPVGVKAITLELSARFLTDAFNEKYFRHDSTKYKTLYEQNKKRAENQFAFYLKLRDI